MQLIEHKFLNLYKSSLFRSNISVLIIKIVIKKEKKNNKQKVDNVFSKAFMKNSKITIRKDESLKLEKFIKTDKKKKNKKLKSTKSA